MVPQDGALPQFLSDVVAVVQDVNNKYIDMYVCMHKLTHHWALFPSY